MRNPLFGIIFGLLIFLNGCATTTGKVEGPSDDIRGYAAMGRLDSEAVISVLRMNNGSEFVYVRTNRPLVHPITFEVHNVAGEVLHKQALHDLGGFSWGADLPAHEETVVVRVNSELRPVSEYFLVQTGNAQVQRFLVERWPLNEQGYAQYVANIDDYLPPR